VPAKGETPRIPNLESVMDILLSGLRYANPPEGTADKTRRIPVK